MFYGFYLTIKLHVHTHISTWMRQESENTYFYCGPTQKTESYRENKLTNILKQSTLIEKVSTVNC